MKSSKTCFIETLFIDFSHIYYSWLVFFIPDTCLIDMLFSNDFEINKNGDSLDFEK